MNSDSASTLLLEEYYATGDARFVEELFRSRSERKLQAFAERWYGDARPFARQALLRYIDDGCDRPGHRALVKALFKRAEAKEDDEVMGHFLVAFDRLARRELHKFTSWDWRTRQPTEDWALGWDPTVPPRAKRQGTYKSPKRSKEGYILYRPLPRFSRATRQYLQRRAWRYFRKKKNGGNVARYASAIRPVLALYQDEHLSKPERLIDAWGLMHALYHGSPVLVREPKGITVADGHTLADLQPAPFCPEAWRGCRDALLDLLTTARSRTVRTFCVEVLKREYAQELRGLTLGQLRPLLDSAHEEVQGFAVELLQSASGLERVPVKEWLSLLEINHPVALPLLCELVEKTVAPERLTLFQCLELACARAAPVAELGLRWAKGKRIASADDLGFLLRLTRAEAPSVRAEGIDWVCQLLPRFDAAKPELVRELLDARHADVRARALELMEKEARFGDSPVLWTAMSESPYDDVREALLRSLAKKEKAFTPQSLQHLWATAVLAVHRGGRTRQLATNQLAERVIREPDEAEALLPILGFALRSIRAPERRSALASLSRVAFQRPALRDALSRVLPELKLVGDEVTS
ncbi:hypothetical protein HPC49_01965 [Pyxidicoccus fallax]|uniref:Uncharacterized protein n=1 Tax=Pyxidicoccus fallax TaxID=394095 RepID=A0A848LAB3_9BACT|nr:hypothetical protein [Pyxidicoccus fallax]NMO13795.1 hypothetical protein [Pyxidicoccus fallax]NPC77018.1 hypothetical protein [Pyxidicoccus fallax]